MELDQTYEKKKQCRPIKVTHKDNMKQQINKIKKNQ